MQDNSYNPVIIGGFVAALVIGAFAIGYGLSENDEGPAEQMGEKMDKALGEAAGALEEGAKKLDDATN